MKKLVIGLLAISSTLAYATKQEIMFEDPAQGRDSIRTLKFFQANVFNKSFCSNSSSIQSDELGNTKLEGFQFDPSRAYLKMVIGNQEFTYLKLLNIKDDKIIAKLGTLTHQGSTIRFQPNQMDSPGAPSIYFKECDL